MSSKGTTGELVHVGKDVYEFCFNFAALREMDEGRGFNCFEDAAKLASGATAPLLVGAVIEVAIVRLNDVLIPPTGAKEAAVIFIERAGFQTAHVTAQKLLTFALVGDEKKRVLKSLEGALQELNKAQEIDGSRSKTFIDLLWLWASRIGNFGLWVWLIFSESGLRSL